MIVVLPGRGMTTRELEENGFVHAVGALDMAADVLLADAHLAYYEDRSILKRLRADVIEPARQSGYKAIWLAGISLGGLGAILYADAHPYEIAGVLAIAPYLGGADGLRTVIDAGGLLRWRAATNPGGESEISDEVWRSAQGVVQRNDAGTGPPLLLGYGLEDRFAPSNQALAESLPRDRVFTAPGGHDWSPWRGLWQRMLVATDLRRC